MGTVQTLLKQVGPLRGKIKDLEGQVRDLGREIRAQERRGRQADPTQELRRRGELGTLRDKLTGAEKDLAMRRRSLEILDQKIDDAVKVRDGLVREQERDRTELSRKIEEQNRAARAGDHGGVRRLADEVRRLNNQIERRTGKIRAAD